MTPLTFRQIIYRLSITGVILGILINTYDVIIGTFLEALHILFEVIEVMMDTVVEEVFHTGVHTTQTIVFYLLIAIMLGLVYALSHAIAKLYHGIVDTCSSCKVQSQLYWQDLSVPHKLMWVAGSVAFFIFTLMYYGLM